MKDHISEWKALYICNRLLFLEALNIAKYFCMVLEYFKFKVKVAQLCWTLWNCSPPGSSVHGILQARILEWVAIPFSRGSLKSRDWTWLFCIAGRFFIVWATREIGWQKLPLCSTKLFLSPKVCTMQRFPLVAMKPCLGWMKTYIGSSQNLNKKPFR